MSHVWKAILFPLIGILAQPDVLTAGKPNYLDVNVSVKPALQGECVEVTAPGIAQPLVRALERGLFTQNKCELKYELEKVPGGFDVVFEVWNPTKSLQKRPAFNLHGIFMGRFLTYLDARDLGCLVDFELGKTNSEPATKTVAYRFNKASTYPNNYSPVAVLFNKSFAVGVSLIYSLPESKHWVGFRYSNYEHMQELLGHLRIEVDLYARRQGYMEPRGRPLLEPGGSDRYRIAVRFAEPEHWLDTLEPYRRFFRETYGEVQYEADLRPVYAVGTAQADLPSADNPRGYFPDSRLDLAGWRPVVERVKRQGIGNGYERVHIWSPSGLYRVGENYPPEFMTRWLPKLEETLPVLHELRDQDMTLGAWWGRAGQISGGWNTGSMWVLDPADPEDVEAAFAELELAEERGFVEIGLDGWRLIPVWDRFAWMKRMQERFPTLRFITEGNDPDIGHVLAPGYCGQDCGPPLLANWLNPGHESWRQLNPRKFTTSEQVQEYVDWGLVPVIFARGLEFGE